MFKKILYLSKRAVFIWKHSGFKAMINMGKSYIARRGKPENNVVSALSDASPDFFWNFIKVDLQNNPFRPQRITDSRKLIINWFIPDFGIGSGGHMTIFRIIHFLEKFGHDNRIYIVGHTNYSNGLDARDAINRHFISLKAQVELGHQKPRNCDILLATSWVTAYYVYRVNNAKQKSYFVQDFEPSFYAMSSEFVFAEQTYKMGYKCITAGPWLANIMRERYGCEADYFELAFEPTVYYPRKIERKKQTIVYYARHVTPRRGVELGILALSIVKEQIPDCEIVLFGWNDYQGIPFEYKNAGILNHEQLAMLYSEATIGMVFSMTNYSLIPHEMMACKLPVVEIKSECTHTVFTEGEAVLADSDPFSIAKEVIALLNNEEKQKLMSEKSYQYVQRFNWEKSARKIESIMKGS
ncbi:glycosyltransferase family 4 protein [Paenibacillus sp. sptzw28]|uniref:glycosyltransferase family 4 protein n=1 Tax=Paenibacillus sp. sptzw28 TaxID=715179 RepID=UPI001C6F2A28|nr:glycosyltransferase family 4 protein [Paenibacillus sp. sptzw28]QYR21216.1 glycosyltransferase family 4 protein [Paenibacillus sp. sptzw28]